MRSGVTALTVAFVVAMSAAAQEPDVSKGEINGRRAFVAMPVTRVERTARGARFEKFLSPKDCLVYFTPVKTPEQELTHPCGKWFLPEEGAYRVWLEMPGAISQGFSVVLWEEEPFQGRGMASAFGMEPAGVIALSPGVRIDEGQSFRFVPLRAVKNGSLWPSFDRRVSTLRARQGAAVAAGSVLAGIFDRKTDEAIALARPVEVQAGKTSYVAPAPPLNGSDVFLSLGRPAPPTLGTHEVRVSLHIGGKEKAPDAYVASASGVYAAWYGIEASEATLRAESAGLHLPPTVVKLKAGKVSTVRTKLVRRPSIGVSIGGPEEMLRESKVALELRTYPARDVVRKLDARVNAEFVFDGLTAGRYEVALLVDDWELREKVSLEEADERVVFTLAPMVVSGVVYHGSDPAPGAELSYDIGRGKIRTKADGRGHYETVFWKPADYIAEIRIPGRPGEPFWDGWLDIRQSQTVDFHVPKTHFVVGVRDAATGRAIAGATVRVGSVYRRANGEGRSAQFATTDAEGRAFLPPMRPGEMTIRANADGYLESDIQRAVVAKDDERGEFQIALRPVGETIAVKIRNPDGTPAVGAAVCAVRATGGLEKPMWTGVADSDGSIAVPRAMRGAFFLVHPRRAAAAVRRLDGTRTRRGRLALPRRSHSTQADVRASRSGSTMCG